MPAVTSGPLEVNAPFAESTLNCETDSDPEFETYAYDPVGSNAIHRGNPSEVAMLFRMLTPPFVELTEKSIRLHRHR
jgi:hypothetical protein